MVNKSETLRLHITKDGKLIKLPTEVSVSMSQKTAAIWSAAMKKPAAR
jgi:hypothetical protein